MKKNEFDILGLISVVVIIIFILSGCIHSNNPNGDNNTSEISQEKRQNLMKITNDFVVEGSRNGFIKKIDNQEGIYIFWIDENMFYQYGYEDREGAKQLFYEYGKLRGQGGIMRGYYSGKYL